MVAVLSTSGTRGAPKSEKEMVPSEQRHRDGGPATKTVGPALQELVIRKRRLDLDGRLLLQVELVLPAQKSIYPGSELVTKRHVCAWWCVFFLLACACISLVMMHAAVESSLAARVTNPHPMPEALSPLYSGC